MTLRRRALVLGCTATMAMLAVVGCGGGGDDGPEASCRVSGTVGEWTLRKVPATPNAAGVVVDPVEDDDLGALEVVVAAAASDGGKGSLSARTSTNLWTGPIDDFDPSKGTKAKATLENDGIGLPLEADITVTC